MADYKEIIDPRARLSTQPPATSNRASRRGRAPSGFSSKYSLPSEQLQALRVMQKSSSDDEVYENREVIQEYVHELLSRSDWILDGEQLDKERDNRDSESFLETLMDLTYYEDNNILRQSFFLMDRIFNQSTEVFELATKAQILTVPSSIQLNQKLQAELPEIRRLAGGIIEEKEMKFV